MNNLEKYPDNNLGKKINPLVVAIRDGLKINTPQFRSKLDKAILGLTGKNEDDDILSDRLVKLSLERVAEEDYSGPLPLDSNLSDEYYSLLKKDLFKEIQERSCFHDYKEIREIIKSINKNTLDGDKVEELVDEAMGLTEGDE
jgi:hypothetical protein